MLHAQWNIANVNGELKGTKNIQISKEEEKNEKYVYWIYQHFTYNNKIYDCRNVMLTLTSNRNWVSEYN